MLRQPIPGPLLRQALRLSLHLSLPLFTAASSVTHGIFFQNIPTASWLNGTRKKLFFYLFSLYLISASVTNVNSQGNALFLEAWKHFKKTLLVSHFCLLNPEGTISQANVSTSQQVLTLWEVRSSPSFYGSHVAHEMQSSMLGIQPFETVCTIDAANKISEGKSSTR